MKIKTTLRKLRMILQGINTCLSIKDKLFQFPLMRNKRLIIEAFKDYDALAHDAGERVKKFDKEREEILTKYSNKTEDGRPKLKVLPGMDNPVFDIPAEEQEKLSKELEEFAEKNKEAVEEKKEHEKKLRELLDAEMEFDCFSIQFKYIPKEVDGTQMDAIVDLIDIATVGDEEGGK